MKSSLHIAILISSLGGIRGGLETIATNLARGLAQRGHRVSIVAGHARPLDLAELPVDWLRVPCLPSTWPLWRWFARQRPGRPLKYQSLSFVRACQVRPQVRRLIASSDVTLTFHEIETILISIWRERSQRPNVSYFSGVIDRSWLRRDRSEVRLAISQIIAERHRLLSWCLIDGVIPPGIPDWLSQLPYVVRSQAQTLIFVGRLEANKGVIDLLKIIEALPAKLHLTLVGDGPLRGELQQRIDRSGLNDRVRLTGSVAVDEVYRCLQAADLFLFPSQYESFGISVLEAEAIGVPVICSDVAGLREAAGDAALRLPLDNLEQWVTAVRKLTDDHAARERMSRIGREHARNFTWDQATRSLESYLVLALDRYSQSAVETNA